jgi:predicted dehydrogenase
MKKLKGAVIGLGGISIGCHIPAWKNMDFVDIVAVCDIIPEKIDDYMTRYGLENTLGFTDYKDVLEIEGLDFVDICTPNLYHSEIAVAALEKGINVFCEKPDAVSVKEALKMQNAAEKSSKTLMVMRNNRYRNTARYLKKYIADGKMGDIYCGRCGWQRRRGIPGKGGWFTTKELSGGGPLIDLGVHMIDLSIWLMGNPTPVAVSGCTFRKFADSDISDSANSSFGEKVAGGVFDVEDLAMGFIRFDNGACLQIEFSWASNIEEEKVFVELRGTKSGSSFEDNCRGTSSLKIFTENNGFLENIQPQIVDEPNIHARNIEHFVDVIMNGAKPDFDAVQGVNMIKILSAMYESAETGREVQL